MQNTTFFYSDFGEPVFQTRNVIALSNPHESVIGSSNDSFEPDIFIGNEAEALKGLLKIRNPFDIKFGVNSLLIERFFKKILSTELFKELPRNHLKLKIHLDLNSHDMIEFLSIFENRLKFRNVEAVH